MRFLSKSLATAFVGAAALVAVSAASHASTADLLTFLIYSTGVDVGGNVVAGNDQHYTSPTGPIEPFAYPGYLYKSTNSQWIGGVVPEGVPVDYTVHFLLGGDPGEKILSGAWGVDDEGLDILINGHSTGISLPGAVSSNYTTLHSFATTPAQSAYFQIGDNTLTFRVLAAYGPGALRADGLNVTVSPPTPPTTLTPTPIPPAILLFTTALGGVGFLGYRRRGAAAEA